METSEEEQSSHKAVIERVKVLLAELVKDPYLSDISSSSSHDELTSQLALEQGRAITIYIRRFNDEIFSVIVLQGASVGDLMLAIQRKVNKELLCAGRTAPVSWRSVWRRYTLSCGQTLLTNRKDKLVNLGVGNRAEVQFVKKLRPKNSSRRRKH